MGDIGRKCCDAAQDNLFRRCRNDCGRIQQFTVFDYEVFAHMQQQKDMLNIGVTRRRMMFRPMLMKKQQLPEQETQNIIENGEIGVLGVSGDDDYPYSVPVNYAYENGCIYIHCGKAGHKLDAMRRNDKVSFVVIGRADIIHEKIDTYYTSAMIFGRARILDNDEEKRHAAWLLGSKYCDNPQAVENEIADTWNRLCCVEIKIEHQTGRQAEALVK